MDSTENKQKRPLSSIGILAKRIALSINQLGSNEFSKLSELVYQQGFQRLLVNICGNPRQHQHQNGGGDVGVEAFTNHWWSSDITLSLNDDGELCDEPRPATTDKELTRSQFETLLLKLFIELAKTQTKSKTLNNHLVDAGWHDDKVNILLQFWNQHQNDAIELLKNYSFDFSSKCLKNVQRKVKILSDHSSESRPNLPLAEIDFQFNDFDKESNQNLTLNFTHKELIKFYDQLENIQNKIDKLYYK